LHEAQVYNVAYSPDGETLATVSSDGKATLWNVASESIIYSIDAERLAFRPVAFSPSGKSFATGDDDGTIRIWDAADGSPQLTLQAHSGPVLELAYGPDDTRVASISTDGTAKFNVLDLDEMIAIAESKLTRSFTEAECRQYLHQATCASD
jgi:WD40 repeat protein